MQHGNAPLNSLIPFVPFVCSFPGSEASYEVISECVDARTLAAAAVYVATAPECKNQAFNVYNGVVFRWSEVGGAGVSGWG